MKMRAVKYLLYLVIGSGLTMEAEPQLVISGQLRMRSELRDGQGSPAVKDTVPAFFTSQRTRLSVGYTGYRFKMYTGIQDVRVWGQDASSINRNAMNLNDGLMVHEAWGEISLVDTGRIVKDLTLKIGRQELVYDDARLLGNLDWLQQARRHDAAILKFEHKGWKAHFGGAFNQNAERKSNTIYNGVPIGYAAGTNGIGNLYKSLQFLYLGRKFKFGNASFLAVKDDYSKFHFDGADVQKLTPIYDQAVWSRYTMGVSFNGTLSNKISLSGSVFYQGGHFREGTTLNEYLVSISTMYPATAGLSFGPGIDITSGPDSADPSQRYQRFDPLYGTPHKFWGSMDYFYAGDGFGANGLTDYYVRTRYKSKDNLTFSLDVHRFVLPQAVTDSNDNLLKRGLGTEMDATINYAMTKHITFESGYSIIFASETMSSPKVKNIRGGSRISNWAYLMISIRPEFILK